MLDQNNHAITLLSAGRTQTAVISKRDIGAGKVDHIVQNSQQQRMSKKRNIGREQREQREQREDSEAESETTFVTIIQSTQQKSTSSSES